jgi:hypothetical protein
MVELKSLQIKCSLTGRGAGRKPLNNALFSTVCKVMYKAAGLATAQRLHTLKPAMDHVMGNHWGITGESLIITNVRMHETGALIVQQHNIKTQDRQHVLLEARQVQATTLDCRQNQTKSADPQRNHLYPWHRTAI